MSLSEHCLIILHCLRAFVNTFLLCAGVFDSARQIRYTYKQEKAGKEGCGMGAKQTGRAKRALGKAGAWIAAALLLCLPLYMKNGYVGLVAAKQHFFWLLAACFALLAAGCAAQRRFLGRRLPRAALWLAGLVYVSLLAALFSADPATAFWGLSGRGNGWLMLLACAVCYVCAVRCIQPGALAALLDVFLLGAGAACLVGWVNFFDGDPLDVYYSLPAESAHQFLSTMGNINFFGALLCLAAPAALWRAAAAESRRAQSFSFFMAIFLTAGFAIANSDGPWLGLAAAVLALLCRRSLRAPGAARVFGALAACFIVWGAVGALARLVPVRCPLRGVSGFVCALPVSAAGFAVCCALAALFFCKELSPRRAGLALAGVACALAAAGVLLANFTDLSLGPLANLFQFDQRWGSNRGYVWGRLLYLFAHELTPLQKLIGVGPDGVNALINPHYTIYIVALNSSTFDSAHNEFLQQLLCAGALGALCWAAFWLSRIRRGLRVNPAFALGLLAYTVQSLFSISFPGAVPLAFLFAAFAGTPMREGAGRARLLAAGGVLGFAAALALAFF